MAFLETGTGNNDSYYEDFTNFMVDDRLPLLPQTEEFIDVIKRLINTN